MWTVLYIVLGIIGYVLMGGLTMALLEKTGIEIEEPPLVALFWPFALLVLLMAASYTMWHNLFNRPPKEESPSKEDDM